MIRVAILVIMAFFLAPILLPDALAHHEDTAILREQNAALIFVEGEEIVTKVIFSTGNFVGDDHSLVYDNTTAYYLTIIDRSAQGIEMPPYNQRIDVPLMSVIIHNYSRSLPEGYWVASVIVRDGASPDGRIIDDQEEHRFMVKGAEYAIIEQQAEATAKSAQVAQEALNRSPMITATAAVLGAGAAAGGTFAVHRYLDNRREEREVHRENEFRNSVRTLIRLELTAYRDLINQTIENNVTKGGPDVLIIPYNTPLRELADRLLPLTGRIADPRNFLSLSPDTKARAFRPEQIRVLEDLYGELQNFGPRNRPPGGSDYEFNTNVITGLRDRINAAMNILENSSDPQPSESPANPHEDLSPRGRRHFEIRLAEVQLELGSVYGWAIALITASIGVTVAILALGQIDTFDELKQLGNLLYLLLATFLLGLALLVLGPFLQRRRMNSLQGGT